MSYLETSVKNGKIGQLNIDELKGLSEEIREKIITTIELNGGHLSSNLGIVETTVALYKTFNFPTDKLVFDVGHQCYAHKLLSERADGFSTIRTSNGLSGFPCREESEYDCFTSGHAGTSISQALGLCAARDKRGEEYTVIAVVGDGSVVNGLNMEALTAANEKPKNLIVILNDNEMSISTNRNGFYKYISKSTASERYVKHKNNLKKMFGNSFVTRFLMRLRNLIKRAFNRNNYFEKFGFKYVGVMDGNNVGEMVKILDHVKTLAKHRAVFLHIKTKKGKGLNAAEEKADEYHGVGKDMDSSKCAFSLALGNKLCQVIEKDKTVVAVTAAMKDGTGLSVVEKAYPSSVIDVGIAEEYAVTLASGMAAGGLKPVVCVYSTFMQRAYDEILHDVCLQKLPVVFCLDRAGLVGADGQTHQGVFDLSYLTHLPNLTVLAPTTVQELNEMVDYALTCPLPVAIRYPNEKTLKERESKPFTKPCWEEVVEGDGVTILAIGVRMLNLAIEVANAFKGKVKVINARSVKPLDEEMLLSIKGKPIITLEENVQIGGFGALVTKFFADNGICNKLTVMGVKDEFIKQGSIAEQLEYNGLTVKNLSEKVAKILTESGEV